MVEAKGQFVPFWFWNGHQLDDETLKNQLHAIHDHGISQVVIHPRFGLGNYLDSAYFYRFMRVARVAENLGMGIWLTDKDWPSGTANGLVTKEDQFVAKAARWKNGRVEIKRSDFQRPYTHSPYVDVMSSAATDRFIETVLKEYHRRVPQYFGNVFRGVFWDEPGMYQGLFGVVDRGYLPYSPELPDWYKKTNGVDLSEDFPLIWGGNGEKNRMARLRYFETIGSLYRENHLGRLRQWCHDHGLKFRGHLLGEEDPLAMIKSQGDPFLALSEFDIPGYDVIGGFNPRKQILAARLAASVADIYGKEGVLAETFGSFGWGLTVEEMRKVLKWQVGNGATMIVPHALFYSLKGSRRHDAPPSLMESPYWEDLGTLAQEFQAQVRANRPTPSAVAVYYPVLAMQAVYNPNDEREARRISRSLQDVCSEMEAVRQSLGINLQFDLLNDYGLLQRLSDYDRLYLPRATVMPTESLRQVCHFAEGGGKVLFYNGVPEHPVIEGHRKNFEEYKQKILAEGAVLLESRKIPKLSLEAFLTSPEAEGIKYLIWHRLSAISPTLETRVSQIRGRLEVLSGYLTRRLTGIERVEGMIDKVRRYF